MNVTILPHMPDGRPAPYNMTARDVVAFCQGDPEKLKNISATMKHYKEKYGLKATQFGKRTIYTLPDVLDMIERMKKENPR